MLDFSVEMSHHITVAKYSEEYGTVSATKAFRGNRERITTFQQLLPSELEPIYIFFSWDESEELIEHMMKMEGLKRSTTGSGALTDKGWTSDNAWDSQSPVARKMITRSFNLTGIVEDAG